MSNSNATDDGTKAHVQHLNEIGAVEKTHVDGTVDLIDTKALGGDLAEMPPGYYYSLHFLGTFMVNCNSLISARCDLIWIGRMSWEYSRVPWLGVACKHAVSCEDGDGHHNAK